LALSGTAWKHIRDRHPEISGYRNLVKNVTRRPDLVVRGVGGEKKAVKWVGRTHLGPKYIVVIYREKGDKKDIITAYFTSDLKRIKGEVEWRV
jgi:hypothetical protein